MQSGPREGLKYIGLLREGCVCVGGGGGGGH